MRFSTTAAALAIAASVDAHYILPSFISDGTVSTAWEYVRQYTTYYTNNPVTNVTSDDIRCNVGGDSTFAPGTLSVAAGSSLGMTSSPAIYHAGVGVAYMAKVPADTTAAKWDGAGAVWFKVHEIPPVLTPGKITFPTDDATNITFTIPKATPSGEYLVRIEHIALHVASAKGAAQFYLSCGQIAVTDGGDGEPGPLVAFPGAYSPTDPGILIDIYNPIPTSYTMPGPAVWTG